MLKYRLPSAVVLLALLGLVCCWPSASAGVALTLAAAALAALCFREFFRLTAAMGFPGYPVLTGAAGVLLLVAVGAWGVAGLAPDLPWAGWCRPGRLPAVEALLVGAVLVGGIGLTLRATDRRVGVLNLLVSLGGYLYVAWASSCLLRIYFFTPANPGLSKVLDALAPGAVSDPRRLGPLLFLFVVLVTKCGDIGGYVVGSLTARRAGGNHPLVPQISPKKSWEGLAGGLALSLVAAVAIRLIVGHDLTIRGPTGAARTLLSVPLAIIFGVVAYFVGLAGDLVESVLKRAAAAKDAGALVPGMGGVLDVVDSLLPVGPLFFVYLSLLAS